MIVSSKITKYKIGEREIAEELILKMIEQGTHNDLILFDSGYPSRGFVKFLEDNNLKYSMRIGGNFLKSVNNVKNEYQIVGTTFQSKLLRMRVLKFQFKSGLTEILITNVFDEEFTVQNFKELYFEGWKIEVKYNEIKNKLQIENFTW